jgi:hypothetical protein
VNESEWTILGIMDAEWAIIWSILFWPFIVMWLIVVWERKTK